MFAVEMLPAGHGDALVVEWGTRNKPHRLLVDAGTQYNWDQVRARLVARRSDRYHRFIVTHVDEDHIGGAIRLLDDPDLRHRIDHVWFNGYVHHEQNPKKSDVLGPIHGEQLTKRVADKGLRWNTDFTPALNAHTGGTIVVPEHGPLPSVDLPGGARLVLLSPSWPKLERMRKVWSERVKKAGLMGGAGASGLDRGITRGIPADREKMAPKITSEELEQAAESSRRDGSAANAASIAFVIEYGKKRALLTGDANPTVLADSLVRYGAEKGEQTPKFDLVKLPHHGSVGNLSKRFLRSFKATRFMVSTNGHVFGHPDNAALARLICGASQTAFYCNYRLDYLEEWAERSKPFGATFKLPKQGSHGLRVTV